MKITARAMVLNNEQKLLTVKHHGSSFWSLPGGKVEAGEDLKEAVLRELAEELGVLGRVDRLAFVHEFRYSPESDVTVEFFFMVDIAEHDLKKLKENLETDELADVSWESVHENLDIKPDFLKSVDVGSVNEVLYYSYV